jgi:transketolase
MTHDSIGLGEDGPTHQPVEHLAALRAMPNLRVFRPCDAVETAECWELALGSTKHPSILALTRQKLAPSRHGFSPENLCARGAYEVSVSEGAAKAVIFASGSEVPIAVAAKKLLDAEGHRVRVVSVPCFELFEAQSEGYRSELLGDEPVRVAVEAGVRMGWDSFIGAGGTFVGMSTFGASAPYEKLYQHFGITSAAVAAAVRAGLAEGGR